MYQKIRKWSGRCKFAAHDITVASWTGLASPLWRYDSADAIRIFPSLLQRRKLGTCVCRTQLQSRTEVGTSTSYLSLHGSVK